MEGQSHQNLIQYCQNLVLPTLAPFDHDKEWERRFELSEQRKKQNRVAQRKFRRFTRNILIRPLNTDCLKGRKRAEPSRNRLTQRAEVSHRGTILNLTYHQRPGEIVQWKRCQSYPRILFHP